MRQREERLRREERRERGRLAGPGITLVHEEEEREEGEELRRVKRTQMERSSAMRCDARHGDQRGTRAHHEAHRPTDGQAGRQAGRRMNEWMDR